MNLGNGQSGPGNSKKRARVQTDQRSMIAQRLKRARQLSHQNDNSSPSSSPSRQEGDGEDPPPTPNSNLQDSRSSDQSPQSIISNSHGGAAGQSRGNATASIEGDYKLCGEPGTGQMFEPGSVVEVEPDVGYGKYDLKIRTRKSTDKDENERAKQIGQSAGMLFLQAEMLRDMGEQLLAQYRASMRTIFRKSAV